MSRRVDSPDRAADGQGVQLAVGALGEGDDLPAVHTEVVPAVTLPFWISRERRVPSQ